MPKISVIIPVYNVEKYLCKCLDSVLNQTFSDIEIICVNDASTDTSLQILNEYRHKDSRITIINNEKNLGLGLTRNHGLQYASGEYVHFLDSDDWIENNAYETLVSSLDNNPDVICFLWNYIDIKNNSIRPEKFKNNIISANFNDNREILDDWGISVWHRLYRRKYLISENVYFNDYRCFEDIEYIYKVLITAKKINFVNKNLINYRINNQASLLGKSFNFYNCAIDSYNTIYEFSKNLSDDRREILLAKLFNSLLYKLVGSFYAGVLDYKALKNIVSNIDLTVFTGDKKSYKWYVYYNEIMNYPAFIIKLRYGLRKYLKNNLYYLYQLLAGFRGKQNENKCDNSCL